MIGNKARPHQEVVGGLRRLRGADRASVDDVARIGGCHRFQPFYGVRITREKREEGTGIRRASPAAHCRIDDVHA
jgi:hypothetical protein